MDRFSVLLESFLREKRHIRKLHIDSYNDFVNNRLQQIIKEYKQIEIETPTGTNLVKFGKIRVEKPQIIEADGSSHLIYPNEARLRSLTYAGPMYLEMVPIIEGSERPKVEPIIGKLPVMLRSDLCPLSKMSPEELIEVGEDPNDPGGYFIINGTERILILIEDLAPNRILLEEKEGKQLAKVFSERRGYRTRHVLTRKKDGLITVSFSRFKAIPIVTLMKALGLEKDKDILNAVSTREDIQKEMYINLYEDLDVETQKDAIQKLAGYFKYGKGKYGIQRTKRALRQYLLSHIGIKPEDEIKKAFYLAKMAEKLIRLWMGELSEDDKDHYANKRVESAGDLLESLFRVAFNGLMRDIKYTLEKRIKRGRELPVRASIRADFLTSNINSRLATGNWVGGRQGVSQRLERQNFINTLSHLRRVSSFLSKTQPHFEARQLHPTHFARLCPTETPEGQLVGLRKALALMAEISSGTDPTPVEKLLVKEGLKLI